ncbi:surfactin synthase thioesterase subunit [Streptosporangium becharense]|uniref:Surfactin synthase thioesterase subunit n=1 Tax=Streptosporangium becharense TaxID=1816182 RepID=A0A7W9IDB6_9ACTN|nr:alpha/beta fold hydrolase [Streptosporangium becharense]MBB2913051.1 surfactin synthase thioesterase subunit [Streptosporangium becharense]MBB5818124.1 surfactin synthase thioesterase subunit [Streptosporangium becharense]
MNELNDVDAWIRRFPQSGGHAGASAVLACFPHAGGSASFYLPVSRLAPSSVEVVAVQYPGRQDRRAERCVDDIGELADRIAEALRPWTGRPLSLFGHSMGATVAFEVARRLEASGTAPLALFASGRRAPSIHREGRVHLRTDEGLLAELRGLGGTASAVLGDEEFMRAVLPMLRSDYRAIETYRYRPGPKLSCPITAFAGADDPKARPEEVGAWRDHTEAGFEMRTFPGGHFYLADHAAEIVNLVAARISSALDALRASSAGTSRA